MRRCKRGESWFSCSSFMAVCAGSGVITCLYLLLSDFHYQTFRTYLMCLTEFIFLGFHVLHRYAQIEDVNSSSLPGAAGSPRGHCFFRLLMKCADVTPDKTATHMEKRRSTFEQSQCRMQRLNLFVVRQSSEWNTVMQIGRGAAIVWWRYGPDTAGLRTNPTLCQSFGSQSSSPTFLPLCSFTVFREIRREKQLGRIGAFFF